MDDTDIFGWNMDDFQEYEKKFNELQGKILLFRKELSLIANERDLERLKDLLSTDSPHNDITNKVISILENIQSNSITKLYDEYFGIEIKTEGKI